MSQTLGLRGGDWVEVRSAAEILATLDDQGCLDALPFMPEMLGFCGQRLQVFKRADKTCDTIHYSGSRRMLDTVHLDDARCSGAAHGGCGAGCLTFWKEAWLKRADTPVSHRAVRSRAPGCDLVQLTAATRQPDAAGSGEIRYRCQATDLLKASTPMHPWDVRQYARDVRSGNVRSIDLVRAAMFRGFLKLLHFRGHRFWMSCYNTLHAWGLVKPFPFAEGKLRTTPHQTLDLQPGEWVQVKSHAEILATLNPRNRNRGLSFDPEMVRYCGSVQRVRSRVNRLIEEGTGRMIELTNDCVILEGAVCHAEYSQKRLFCPRSLFPYWREIWLRRVKAPAALAGAPVVETRDTVSASAV